MRKAVFFSLDAILALIVALALSAAIFSSMNAISGIKMADQTLLQLSQDALAVMEKQGILQKAVTDNSNQAISDFASALPQNVCQRISIAGQNGEIVTAEENCACSAFSVSKRSFVTSSANATVYLAEMRACYK